MLAPIFLSFLRVPLKVHSLPNIDDLIFEALQARGSVNKNRNAVSTRRGFFRCMAIPSQ